MPAIKYNLTQSEIKELRRRCKIANLPWRAQAARPSIARQLLSDRRLDVVHTDGDDPIHQTIMEAINK